MIIRNMTASLIATMHEKTRYTLKPGVNDLPPEVWESWSKTKVMQALVAEKKIVAPEVEAEKAPQLANLDSLKPKEATDLVKQTFDAELLEKWVTDEKRTGVIKAIEKQLEAIDVKAKAEDQIPDDAGDDEEKPES